MTSLPLIPADQNQKAEVRRRLIFWLLAFAVEVALSICILAFIASVWVAWFLTGPHG
jgi:hypothetical protein